MAVALADSSAIVAYIVEGDTLHASAVETIESTMRSGSSLAISAVSWSELLHGALLGHFPERVLRDLAEDFGIDVLQVDKAVAERAAALQRSYRDTTSRRPRPRLRTPDALILATAAADAEIERVICGDEKWAKVPGVDAEVVLLAERH